MSHWVRVEGPGSLRHRRWHRVGTEPAGRYTACGVLVRGPVTTVGEPNDIGLLCQRCLRAADRRDAATSA